MLPLAGVFYNRHSRTSRFLGTGTIPVEHSPTQRLFLGMMAEWPRTPFCSIGSKSKSWSGSEVVVLRTSSRAATSTGSLRRTCRRPQTHHDRCQDPVRAKAPQPGNTAPGGRRHPGVSVPTSTDGSRQQARPRHQRSSPCCLVQSASEKDDRWCRGLLSRTLFRAGHF